MHNFPIFRGTGGDPQLEQLILGWVDGAKGVAGEIPQNPSKIARACIRDSQVGSEVRHWSDGVMDAVLKIDGGWCGVGYGHL